MTSSALVWAYALALIACKASVNADASFSGSASGGGRADDSSDIDQPLLLASAAPAAGETQAVLLGARYDLKLQAGAGSATCRCLSVALGNSQSSGMVWAAGAPTLDDATQLAIAFSSVGAECDGAPAGGLGASYWGYKISGHDVLVLVEEARAGRPLTTGAIIPRPVGQGRVLLSPTSARLPYGRSLDGKGPCALPVPGPSRPLPFTEAETGANAPRPTQSAAPSMNAPAE